MARDIGQWLERAHDVSEYLKALSHETRLLIVCLLQECEYSVAELEQELGGTQSNMSQHLAKLRERGIVVTQRQGNQIFYSLKDQGTRELIGVLQKYFCDSEDREV